MKIDVKRYEYDNGGNNGQKSLSMAVSTSTPTTLTSSKSSSERMAAKALTELSYSSKTQIYLDNEKISIISTDDENPNKVHYNHSVNALAKIKEEPMVIANHYHCEGTETIKKRNSFSKCDDTRSLVNAFDDFKEALITDNNQDNKSDDLRENILNLQQRLETAAVLMDISKKVVISPPCSNPESPNMCIETDPSIINSVIKLNRPNNNHRLHNSMLMKMFPKKGKFDLVHLSNILMSQHSCNASSIKNFELNEKLQMSRSCIFDCNNSKQGILTAIDSDHSTDSNRLGTDINTLVEHRSPESIVSEDHGTDAATTQLWQALAQSAGNYL